MNKFYRIILIIFWLFIFNGFLASEEITEKIDRYKTQLGEKDKNLEEIKNQIKAKKQKAAVIKTQEQDVNKQIKNINAELVKLQKSINRLNRLIKITLANIEVTQQKLEQTQIEAQVTKEILKKHLLLIYKTAKVKPDYLYIVFTENSFQRIIIENKFLKIITQQDAKLYQDLIKKEEEIAITEVDLQKKKQALEDLQGQVKNDQQQVIVQKKEKDKLLQKLQAQRKNTEEEVSQLEKEARDLQNLINNLRQKVSALEKVKEKRHHYAKKMGEFIWPVKGEVASYFGKQKHNHLNTYIINNGIEIKAPSGTNVVAIEQGIVLYADTFKNYGPMVILDHGDDFYTVYAHLKEFSVKVGDKINKEQIIGTVGINLREGYTSLYFEIRDKGKPTDPLLWLKQ